jgi:hypothetical protein
LADPQTPPSDARIIELTEVVRPVPEAQVVEAPVAPPAPEVLETVELPVQGDGELEQLLTELSQDTPPPPQEDDLEKLLSEMGGQPLAMEAPPAEADLKSLLAELEAQAQPEPVIAEPVQPEPATAEPEPVPEAGGTGDPELDRLLKEIGDSSARPGAEKSPVSAEPPAEQPAEPAEPAKPRRKEAAATPPEAGSDTAPEMAAAAVAAGAVAGAAATASKQKPEQEAPPKAALKTPPEATPPQAASPASGLDPARAEQIFERVVRQEVSKVVREVVARLVTEQLVTELEALKAADAKLKGDVVD